MRRTRGGNRGGQSWQPRTSGGPLMTDHLGLQDIDKELELLQRKREIIEQQQQILSNEFRGRNDYEESYSQSSRFDNFTPSFTDRRDYNPPSRKRPIPVWEDDLPNKRFSGPSRPRTTRPYTRPAPPPLMRSGPFNQSPRQQVRPQSGPFKPKPQKKDAPPKVTKPAAAPNKLKTYPVAERKKLIADAIDLTSDAAEANRLCSDREPSKQLTGRLELALGSIIKEIKANAEPQVVKSSAVMREIKMTVRDRIREVMMGKIVGSADTIIARYREAYDKQSDIEIIANALEAQTGEVTLLKIDDPEKYFKINMHRIMHMKLKKLLDKLDETCRNEMDKNAPKSGDGSVTKMDDAAEQMPDDLPDADKNPLDERITSTEKFKSLEKWMTIKMTALIKKFLPYFMKLMDMDMKYSRLKNMITSETVKMLMQKDCPEGEIDTSDVAMKTVTAALNMPNTNTPRTPYKPLPYFAKLMGKPGLPKRNQMEQFFEQFNPKSIKKHRTVHNLLFVGFVEKENFDKFLAADGTTIGKYVLSIRVSERSKTEQAKKELDTSNISDDKLIGSELDDQITDLLTSIRKAEETEGGDENIGEIDVKMEGDATENANANDGTPANADENNAGNADENNTGNADESISSNADENDVEIVEKNADENIVEIIEDADENDVEVAEKNADVNDVETIEKNADENVVETVGENVDKNVVETEENTDEITKNAEPETADKIATDKPANGDENTEPKAENDGLAAESTDKVQPLEAKPIGKATPVRMSTRLAGTPGRIQTRRASKLAQNDA